MYREKRMVEALSQRDFEVVSELRTEQSDSILSRLRRRGSAVSRENGITLIGVACRQRRGSNAPREIRW